MKFLFSILYQFLKLIAKTSIGLYFTKTTVLHPERLKIDHPAILISNHPNTLMDPIQVAMQTNKQVAFLANAGLFKSSLGNWFFRQYCVPIQRKTDAANKNVNNTDSFKECNNFLSQGGCLYIAPEGTSDMERRLRPIKTGTARIALAAEASQDFKLGLKIIPVGLTYDAPNYFGSRLIVHVGEAIEVSDYQKECLKNNFGAIKKLTKRVKIELGSLLINTTDAAEDKLVHQIETIYANDKPLSSKDTFFRTQAIVEKLKDMKEKQPAQLKQYKENISVYFDLMDMLGLNDLAVVQLQKGYSIFSNFFKLLLGFPFFLYGFINNALPAFITIALTRKLNLYVGYSSTVKILGGLLFFGVFYGFQTWLFHQWIGNGWWTMGYVLSLIPSGILAWQIYQKWQQFKINWKARNLVGEINDLDKKRKELFILKY